MRVELRPIKPGLFAFDPVRPTGPGLGVRVLPVPKNPIGLNLAEVRIVRGVGCHEYRLSNDLPPGVTVLEPGGDHGQEPRGYSTPPVQGTVKGRDELLSYPGFRSLRQGLR